MIALPKGSKQPLTELPPARESAHIDPARSRRRLGVKLSTVLGMALAGGLAFTTAVPANAVAAVNHDQASVYAPAGTAELFQPQTVVIADDVAGPTSTLSEAYAVVTGAQKAEAEAAAAAAAAQAQAEAEAAAAAAAEAARPKLAWPTTTTAVSDGFGNRAEGFHDGVDFVPGNGSPVMSIADGVVTAATENGGTWGVMVTVQHVIEGQTVYSLYAHMQYGSLQVQVGQSVQAGQQLGVVGSTGWSTGPHMHLEMWGTDGVRFDGLPWLHARLG